ncbi:MAG: SpoIID/LytB domain-containing protein [Acidimicrobiales bacterium]
MHSSIVRNALAGPRHDRRALPLIAVAASLVVAVPLAAATADATSATPIAAIDLVGHGYGPGFGMGQWGDFGDAVRYHETYAQILSHFYGGTVASSLEGSGLGANPTISVVILENVKPDGMAGYDPVVTSPSAFTVTGAGSIPPTTTTSATAPTVTTSSTTTSSTTPTTTSLPTTTSSTTAMTAPATPPTTRPASSPTSLALPSSTTSTSTTSTTSATTAPSSTTTTTVPAEGLAVPAGMAVDLRLTRAGTWSVYESTSCATARASAGRSVPVATGLVDPTIRPASASADAPPVSLLTLCRHDGIDEVVRGDVEAYDWSGHERTLNLLPLQSYLDGVVPAEESPAWGSAGAVQGAPQGRAWGFQALEAQAVASRSYAAAYLEAGGWEGYASICDTVCEAYVGENFESSMTDAAVVATFGVVRVDRSTGDVALTSYSASSGGWTALSAFPAVPDPGDACVVAGNPLECNPNHTWQLTFPSPLVSRRIPGIGPLVGVTVLARNQRGSLGGRVESIVVTGTKSSTTLTGWEFATALGLPSDWFAVTSAT